MDRITVALGQYDLLKWCWVAGKTLVAWMKWMDLTAESCRTKLGIISLGCCKMMNLIRSFLLYLSYLSWWNIDRPTDIALELKESEKLTFETMRGVRTSMTARCSCTGQMSSDQPQWTNGKSHPGIRRRCQIHPKSKFGKNTLLDFWVDFLPWKRKSKLRVNPQAKLRGFLCWLQVWSCGIVQRSSATSGESPVNYLGWKVVKVFIQSYKQYW